MRRRTRCSCRLAQPETLCCAPVVLVKPCLYVASPSWWEHVRFCLVLTVPFPSVLVYYTNLVGDEHPGAAEVSHIAVIEFIKTALMRFQHAAERGLFGF